MPGISIEFWYPFIGSGLTLLYQAVDAIAAVAHMLYFAKARWPG